MLRNMPLSHTARVEEEIEVFLSSPSTDLAASPGWVLTLAGSFSSGLSLSSQRATPSSL